jgi:SAM-dependent methyltransferase
VAEAALSLPPALERTLDLFEPDRRPSDPDVTEGYLNLLGAEDPTGSHPGQRWMASSVLPLVYERVWRPVGGRILIGLQGGMAGEQRAALEMLALKPKDRVLDVACGPGNFTRVFANEVGDSGLAVGLDASRTMLRQAVQEDNPPNAAYVLGDAAELPFRDGSFDAVCCFAALYFIQQPYAAIDEMVRVLAPGGRLALMTSVNRGLLPLGVMNAVVQGFSGVRVFSREELVDDLREHDLLEVRQRVAGFAQFVSARRPAAA